MKYIYITNRPEIAAIAQGTGVDRICVDMEYIGKAQRQKGMNTALNRHSFGDVASIRRVIDRSELLVRVNPIHDTQEDGYPASEEEIDRVIKAGADIVMLPYYKTEAEASRFLEAVDGRAKTMLLLETAEAAKLIDAVGVTDAADEIHIEYRRTGGNSPASRPRYPGWSSGSGISAGSPRPGAGSFRRRSCFGSTIGSARPARSFREASAIFRRSGISLSSRSCSRGRCEGFARLKRNANSVFWSRVPRAVTL